MSKLISGKYRRYNHKIFLKNFLNPIDMLLNFRDILLIIIGLIQSFIKLLIWRPDVVFAKGGFVSLPVGIAAKLLGVPIVIHDSDAHPGLTNRVLSTWAKYIATGAPAEYYNYPINKVYYLGVPISSNFFKYDKKQQLKAKLEWGFDPKRPLIVVTGGGLGASRLNIAIAQIIDKLLAKYSIALISGSANYDKMKSIVPKSSNIFQLYPFISENIDTLFGAADVVVARAGATTIQELSAMSKPTILVPNLQLTGGHQYKNAKVYSNAKAAEILIEDDISINPEVILNKICEIIEDENYRDKLSANFSKFAKPNAALDVADLIIKASKTNEKK